jgi:hypothetical protein
MLAVDVRPTMTGMAEGDAIPLSRVGLVVVDVMNIVGRPLAAPMAGRLDLRLPFVVGRSAWFRHGFASKEQPHSEGAVVEAARPNGVAWRTKNAFPHSASTGQVYHRKGE